MPTVEVRLTDRQLSLLGSLDELYGDTIEERILFATVQFLEARVDKKLKHRLDAPVGEHI